MCTVYVFVFVCTVYVFVFVCTVYVFVFVCTYCISVCVCVCVCVCVFKELLLLMLYMYVHTTPQLMVEIGNDRSNLFWEKHCKQERLKADVERDIRESFILAKYKDHSWIPEPSGEDRETLSRQLNICVASNNLMRTIQLLVHRADVRLHVYHCRYL